ncbi:hypothetical protein GNX71_29125 [Variovorax sp. RKNM96]|uniref:hypothetical protein n=1 Tax=Variovorax sp. RKNM96 TaxID=2681552 RepID=UPI00197EA54F|nr:hypothetical protein [Variovorax sp. RKNM96]QSI33410.1 hypothetical protein GNX71_29125 [Variovorax sp. RKNM96]
MSGSRSNKQRGFMVWVLMLVLAGAAIGAWRYSLYREESKRAQQAAAEQLQKDQRKEAERAELEKRLAEGKRQQDSLVAAQKSMDDLLVRWDDAVKIASSTSRISLSTPVALLQDIRRDAERLTLPPCMDGAKANLVSSMNSTIKGFMVFMRNELKIGDTLARIDFDEAAKHMVAFNEGKSACPQ